MPYTFEFLDKEETILSKVVGEGHCEIPNTVQIIKTGAFSTPAKLTSVNIPNSVKIIEIYMIND